MDFYSAYRQGFVRVAACTHHTAHRRPRGQRRVGAAGRPCLPRRRRRAGGLPGADAVRLLDRGHPAAGRAARRGRGRAARHRRGVRRAAARAGGRRAAASPAPDLQHRRRDPPRQRARRGPKSYLPTYREFYERRQVAAGDDRARRDPASAGRTCRSGPTCCSPPPTCRDSCCTSRSARTCSCRSRRARRRRWRVRRCWPTCPAARSRSGAPRTAACWRVPRRRGAWPPTSTPRRERASPPPTWPGTARR